MSTSTIPRQRSAPVTSHLIWEAVATSSLAITREARNDRRTATLTTNARRMLTALGRLGVHVQPTRVLALPTGMRIGLTQRESQVLLGMSKGMSNAEIGRRLYITEDTVKTHSRRLYRKLGARNRAHAVAEGFRRGVL